MSLAPWPAKIPAQTAQSVGSRPKDATSKAQRPQACEPHKSIALHTKKTLRKARIAPTATPANEKERPPTKKQKTVPMRGNRGNRTISWSMPMPRPDDLLYRSLSYKPGPCTPGGSHQVRTSTHLSESAISKYAACPAHISGRFPELHGFLLFEAMLGACSMMQTSLKTRVQNDHGLFS